MSITLTIQDQPNGAALPDLTPRLNRATFSTNLHGDESLSVSAPLSLAASFQRYDRAGLPHAIVTDGAATPFQGRVEDTAIKGAGIDLTAFGYQRALSDGRYTALWSTTNVAQFRPIRTDEVANHTPELFRFDTNNRVQIALPQGSIYGNNTNVGAMIYQAPYGGSRQIVGVSFDAVVTLPTNFLFVYETWNEGYTGGAAVTIDTGIGGTQTINRVYNVGAVDYFAFAVYNSTGANYTVNNAPNVWSVRITNVRLVTSLANMVNTTTTAIVAAGANVLVPVVTSARMYVGQRLHMGTAGLGEGVTVLSIPDSTHFRANLGAGYASGQAVYALVVYADEIVKDLISKVSTANSTQLLPDTTQVTSPALDLFDELFLDQVPSAVLDHLLTLGDNATVQQTWEWGVTGLRSLYYRVAGGVNQTWYVDITDLTVQRSLDQLYNSAYAVYQEPGGRVLRGAVSTDAASVTQTGITRTQNVPANTTSLVQANVQRDASLEDTSDPAPRFGLTFRAVYNAAGGRVPLWLPRAGDTLIIRNLPPTVSTSIDQVRSFRIARTSCDLIARTLTVEPLTPLPSIQALLARITPPSWVTAPWWQQVGQK